MTLGTKLGDVLGTILGTTVGRVLGSGAGIGGALYVGGIVYSAGSPVVTSATLGNYGVSQITAGTDTSINTSTGNVTISNTSTLQTITNRGATTTNAINISNTTVASSTTTGALQVAGGVGIGNNLYIGGTLSHTGLTPTIGLNIDQVYTTSTSLTLSTAWQNTNIVSTVLTTGSYMVQVLANDSAQGGGQVNTYYTGIMSWYSGATNETSYDEIILHRAGSVSSTGTIFLQVLRAISGTMSLQIAGTTANASTSTYNFSFRRMI